MEMILPDTKIGPDPACDNLYDGGGSFANAGPFWNVVICGVWLRPGIHHHTCGKFDTCEVAKPF